MVPTQKKQLSRRDFIKNSTLTSVGLWLGFSANGSAVKKPFTGVAKNFSPYILVEPGGVITLYNIKPEMGQGTFQSIPALIAEEFEVSLEQVIIKNTNGEKEFGSGQRAGGSSSVRGSYVQMRKIGAAARELFITAASNKWNVSIDTCYAENGKVVHKPTGNAIAYGDLLDEASKLELPKEPTLKNPKDFKILGKPMKRPDIPLKTNGSAEFGIDVRVPGMLYASVERCPVIGGTLKSFDASETLAVKGVIKVVEAERIMGRYHSTGVAVIANSYWTALKARKKLKIVWDTKGFEQFNSIDYENNLRTLSKQDGLLDKNIGAVDTLNLLPENILEAFYETPMVAHHPLEVMNCVAQVQGDKVEIWTSTQVASTLTGNGVNDLHKHIDFNPDNIKLHSTFIGGGFGRRLNIDYVIEAVNIAKQITQPVKVIWSREDTTEQGPFRPMTFSQLKAGFTEEGKLVSLQHKVISPSYQEAMNANFDTSKVDGIMVEGIGEQAYEIPNIKTSYVRADYHVPVAAWRSVTSSTLSFPHECFIDELAHKAKKDPMDFRLSLLSKPSDLKRILLTLREISGWDKPLPPGKARGVAQWEFFAGLCAHVVEITLNKDASIKVDKVYAVIDLGEVVNPDNVKNQVEGAIVMALGAATKAGIVLENGKVTHHNFYDSQLIRMNEVPEIEVYIMTEGGRVKGVGEPGLPPFAPALANAIFAATGKRIRRMPFDLRMV